MKLIKAEITEFASMKDRVFEFGEGMNIIEGNNESGKSTLLAFIKFMLYGFQRHSAQSGEPNEKDKYVSWSGRRACGALTAEAGGKTWRIERDGYMSKTARGESYNEKPVQIIDAETGAVALRNVCPGEYFLGMTAAVFSSTCAVAQLAGHSINSDELGNCIENMLQSADESISVNKVIKRLDDARKELIYKNGRGGKIYDLKVEEQNLTLQLAKSEENAKTILELENEAKKCKEKTQAAMHKQSELSDKWDKSEAWLIINRFERVKERRKEISELKEYADGLRKNSFPDSFEPDSAYIQDLHAVSQKLNKAQTDASGAELRQKEHESFPEYDVKKAELAESLESRNESTATQLSTYGKLKKRISHTRVPSVLLFIAGFLCAVSGGSLLALSYPYKISVPLLAAGVIMIICGGILMGSIGKKNKQLLDFLNTADLHSDIGAEKFSVYLDRCFKAKEDKIKHLDALEALKMVSANCRDTLENVMREANEKAVKVGVPQRHDTNSILDALSSAITVSSAYTDKIRALNLKIQAAEEDLQTLEQSVAEYDETFIRARAGNLEESEALSPAEHDRLKKECTAEVQKCYGEQTAVERRISYYEGQQTSPAKISSQLDNCKNSIEKLSLRADALILANESVEKASGKLRRGFTPTLRRKAGSIIAPLTDSKYSELGISDDFSLSLIYGGSTRPVSYMSGGTKDASYLALRLALTELLGQKENAPVLLDEALSQLDNTRASALLDMLAEWCKKGNQCMIFTCHSREAQLAQDFTHIKL